MPLNLFDFNGSGRKFFGLEVSPKQVVARVVTGLLASAVIFGGQFGYSKIKGSEQSVDTTISAESVAVASGPATDSPSSTQTTPATTILVAAETIAATTTTTTDVGTNYYTVQPGDTLIAISKRLNIDTQQLMEMNGISNPNQIEAGQYLQLPPATGYKPIEPSTTQVGVEATASTTATTKPISSTAINATPALTTTATPPISNFKAISLSLGDNFSCALSAASLIACWGNNYTSRLGDGTSTSRSFASAVFGNRMYAKVFAGRNRACGIAVNGHTYCWGSTFGRGFLGTRNGDAAVVPEPLVVDPGFDNIYLGETSSCGITKSFDAYCWGREASPTSFRSWAYSATPTNFDPSVLISEFAGGESQSCYLDRNGSAFCWEYRDNDSRPSLVNPFGSRFLLGTLSGYPGSHSCAKSVTGDWVCWGEWMTGQLGTYDQYSDCLNYPGCQRANRLPQELSFTMVTSGDGFSCGLLGDGTVYCWGKNDLGQLGRGYMTIDNSTISKVRNASPAPIAGGKRFLTISAGTSHTCGVQSVSNNVWCWGSNSLGQLGDLSRTDSSTPVAVLQR